MRTAIPFLTASLLALAGPTAHASSLPPYFSIANGLGRPDNDINFDLHQWQLYVNNVGCWTSAPCDDTGDPTTVALVAGGLLQAVDSRDSSTFVLDGGTVLGDLYAGEYGNFEIISGEAKGTIADEGYGSVVISGGTVDGGVGSRVGSVVVTGGTVENGITTGASLRVSGGSIQGDLIVDGIAEIDGSGFAVNGVPVAFGDVSATTGVLTGVLASGDPLSVSFYRSGFSTLGQIQLVDVPEPQTLTLVAGTIVVGICLRRIHRRA